MGPSLRFVWSVFGMVAVAPAALAAQTLRVSIPTVACVVGHAAIVPISLVGAAQVGALQFEVVYDPSVLDVTAVQRGALLAGMDYSTLESNAGLTPGRLKVALINQFPLADDGVLLEIQGQCRGGAGQRNRLTIENAAATRNETAMGDIPVQSVDGELSLVADPTVVPPRPALVGRRSSPTRGDVAPSRPPNPVAPARHPPAVIPAEGGGASVVRRSSISVPVASAVVALVLGVLAAGGAVVLRRRRRVSLSHGTGRYVQLAVVHPDGTTQVVSLTSHRLTVGRRAGNDIRLPDPYVSGVHAEILAGSQGVSIRDLGSTGGTSVNGHPIAVSPLQVGDEIVVGTTRLLLKG